jgi:hypothetical protein
MRILQEVGTHAWQRASRFHLHDSVVVPIVRTAKTAGKWLHIHTGQGIISDEQIPETARMSRG